MLSACEAFHLEQFQFGKISTVLDIAEFLALYNQKINIEIRKTNKKKINIKVTALNTGINIHTTKFFCVILIKKI